MPFEIRKITIEPDGFQVAFTKPVDAATGGRAASYRLATFTHPYQAAYGGPEIERTEPEVQSVVLADDGLSVKLRLGQLIRGHVYDFDLGDLRSRDQDELLHRKAYYTVNEIPTAKK
jgi:hypothetical protein